MGDAAETTVAQAIATLRPRLHRYCARMVGSALDGEDVVQDAIVKALEAAGSADVARPEAWLFRIAHNTALDHLRRRARTPVHDGEAGDLPDPSDDVARREAAAAGLRLFMRLTAAERSSVILKDVVGHSIAEIGEITGATVPAVKAALHRGRGRLARLAEESAAAPLPLSPADAARLGLYADRFNARDFDAVREMLLEDVRLDLVGRLRLEGRGEVAGRYLGTYAGVTHWRFDAGAIDGRPAVVVSRVDDASRAPAYVVELTFRGDKVAAIRDFFYAGYVVDGAEIVVGGG